MLVVRGPDVSGIVIDCGGPGDSGAIGGAVVDRGNIQVAGTDRPNLFRRERWGLTGYKLDVDPGVYDVHLGFAETFPGVTAAGQRVFGIKVNGVDLGQVDVFALAGGSNRAVSKIACGVDAKDGVIEVVFVQIKGDPMISVLEVTLPGAYRDAEAAKPSDPPEEPKPEEPKPPQPPVEPRPGIQPPAHAKAAGLTKLIFEEDFLDASRFSRTTGLRPGQTFCLMGPGNPVWGASPLPVSAVRIEGGEIELTPNNTNYQGDIISSASQTSGFLLRGNRWCTEIRWKHPRKSASKGFPAFWSMDARHWYENKAGELFLEPDFYEFIGGRHIGALHYWKSPHDRPQPMQQVSGGPLPDVTQFFTCGAMSVPGEYSWWVAGRKMGGKSPPWLDGMMRDFRGPIIIGSGPEFPLVIDYVRVWGQP